MQITGVTPEQFRDVVRQVSDRDYGGNLTAEVGSEQSRTRFRGRVVLVSTGYRMFGPGTDLAPGQRRSASQRRAAAVCWHGYRDVLRELFNAYPDARVYTALAKYRGREEFYRNYPPTGRVNIGSAYEPATMPALCDCPIGARWEDVLA